MNSNTQLFTENPIHPNVTDKRVSMTYPTTIAILILQMKVFRHKVTSQRPIACKESNSGLLDCEPDLTLLFNWNCLMRTAHM